MPGQTDHLRLSRHILGVKDAGTVSSFYRNRLGMKLIDRSVFSDTDRIQLGFSHQSDTLLELHQSHNDDPNHHYTHQKQDAYWKIGITLADVDRARNHLLEHNIAVSEPSQFRDIGYLCHLNDPAGFCIELLQYTFAKNFSPMPADTSHPLGGKPNLGQITLRIRDPLAALDFYRDFLGMKLLSRQIVEPYGFTLYFLACTAENPPHADPDAVGNREWLWQRPYTTLELQHRWDTPADFQHGRHGYLGFLGLGFTAPNLDRFRSPEAPGTVELIEDPITASQTAILHDPDGNPILISEA